MDKELSAQAQAYVDKRGLIFDWRARGRTVERPQEGHNLELKLFNEGKQIACMNNGNIAILKDGDVLEMRNFNRYVKRMLQLPSKDRVNVIVTTGKSGLLGIQCANRFLPFDAIRGFASFGVESLARDHITRERGERVTI
ncbi:MAG TPA: hypothetical protein VHQ41_04070 [Patescibacteria group bacterium]|nr:hypothetical protein [Patescibacteria group bacterium]